MPHTQSSPLSQPQSGLRRRARQAQLGSVLLTLHLTWGGVLSDWGLASCVAGGGMGREACARASDSEQ